LEFLGTKRFADIGNVIGGTRGRFAWLVSLTLRRLVAWFRRIAERIGGLVSA
jgi:hypothetical protein